MYLFIYLFGSLPAPSFHGCCHSFFSSFPPLTWGPFGEGSLCSWGDGTQAGTAAAAPRRLRGPSPTSPERGPGEGHR